MPAISEIQTTSEEFVITERVVTNNFIVRTIQEDVENKVVRVQIEVGPFVDVPMPTNDNLNNMVPRGKPRLVTVWAGAEYDAIRDTWTNSDLLAALPAKI